MSDEPLTNAAVEFVASMTRATNALEQAPSPTKGPLTEDFHFEDRRPGSPVHGWGRVNRSEAIEMSAELFNLGAGHPQRTLVEVVAIRGDTCVAYVESIDAGNGFVLEHINCVAFNSEIQLIRRIVRFDVGDRDAAIAELDRLHAEVDD